MHIKNHLQPTFFMDICFLFCSFFWLLLLLLNVQSLYYILFTFLLFISFYYFMIFFFVFSKQNWTEQNIPELTYSNPTNVNVVDFKNSFGCWTTSFHLICRYVQCTFTSICSEVNCEFLNKKKKQLMLIKI